MFPQYVCPPLIVSLYGRTDGVVGVPLQQRIVLQSSFRSVTKRTLYQPDRRSCTVARLYPNRPSAMACCAAGAALAALASASRAYERPRGRLKQLRICSALFGGRASGLLCYGDPLLQFQVALRKLVMSFGPVRGEFMRCWRGRRELPGGAGS